MARDKEEKRAESEKRENALANFGWSRSLINSDKELKRLFDQAVDKAWSTNRFIAEVRDTKWFRKHSEAWRTNETLRITDNGEWLERRDKAIKNLRDGAAKAGAVLSDKQLERLATNVMTFGWDEAQQRDVLANYIKTVNSGPLRGQYFGDAGRNAEALREAARANGYPIGDKELSRWNKEIIAGDRSVEDYQAYMRRQAALTFPSFATELDAGTNMLDIARPYVRSMADILEINPEKIDLHDPTIRKALASKNEKTGKPEAMAMYDFEDSLRKDPRWLYTDNAHQQVMGSARNLLRSFGLTA